MADQPDLINPDHIKNPGPCEKCGKEEWFVIGQADYWSHIDWYSERPTYQSSTHIEKHYPKYLECGNCGHEVKEIHKNEPRSIKNG